ncbi:uncharacterized protein LOC129404384 [Sorex araneus]|uniref:uncharacterized protein LOC129404384 n=1 Tax=Sorex araneus TaxID=42254 RepID=UPI002433ABE6|nr:uncharacterized protein LOC129404384 [Sorex araneus]
MAALGRNLTELQWGGEDREQLTALKPHRGAEEVSMGTRKSQNTLCKQPRWQCGRYQSKNNGLQFLLGFGRHLPRRKMTLCFAQRGQGAAGRGGSDVVHSQSPASDWDPRPLWLSLLRGQWPTCFISFHPTATAGGTHTAEGAWCRPRGLPGGGGPGRALSPGTACPVCGALGTVASESWPGPGGLVPCPVLIAPLCAVAPSESSFLQCP